MGAGKSGVMGACGNRGHPTSGVFQSFAFTIAHLARKSSSKSGPFVSSASRPAYKHAKVSARRTCIGARLCRRPAAAMCLSWVRPNLESAAQGRPCCGWSSTQPRSQAWPPLPRQNCSTSPRVPRTSHSHVPRDFRLRLRHGGAGDAARVGMDLDGFV
jgi:hypothetical protein